MSQPCKTCKLPEKLKKEIEDMLETSDVKVVYDWLTQEKGIKISYSSFLRHARNCVGKEKKWNFDTEDQPGTNKPDLKPQIFSIPLAELRQRLNIPTSFESGEEVKKTFLHVTMQLWLDQACVCKHYQELCVAGTGKMPKIERQFFSDLSAMLLRSGKMSISEMEEGINGMSEGDKFFRELLDYTPVQQELEF